MDMTMFAPREIHPALAHLAKFDWLDGRIVGREKVEFVAKLRDVQPSEHDGLIRTLIQAADQMGMWYGHILSELRLVGNALKDGPKVFAPSSDICTALENVELNIPWSEYRLPFPTLVIKYPADWCGCLVRMGAQIPPTAALLGFVTPDILYAGIRYPGGENAGLPIVNDARFESMEGNLDRSQEPSDEARAMGFMPRSDHERLLLRVTLNLGLLLTYTGTKDLGWVSPKDHERHERLARRGDARGRRLAMGEMRRVDMAKPIKVWAETRHRETVEPSGGLAASTPSKVAEFSITCCRSQG